MRVFHPHFALFQHFRELHDRPVRAIDRLLISVKKATITAYCHGYIPAWAVRAVFALFPLRDK